MNWTCPICSLALQSGTVWRCDNAHSFDRAKEGYVNLLPVNRKRSREPGDSADMLQSRRRFLEAGHYRPLVDAIVAMLPYEAGLQLLDIGSGEGYYLRALQAAGWPQDALGGIDISKAGARLAAKRQSGAQFVVAGSYDIPLQDHSIARLLRIFAPAAESELLRVLKPGGVLLDVAPGPEHLWSLKTALYNEARPHEPPKAIAGFNVDAQLRCCFTFTLRGHEAIADFLGMTPFAWKGDAAVREALAQRDTLELEADFVVRRLSSKH